MTSNPNAPGNDRDAAPSEKDLYRKQFLKMRNNYEDKVKELSVIKELVDRLRLTGICDRKTLFEEQLRVIKRYFNLEHISLMLLTDEAQQLEVVASLNDGSWIDDFDHDSLTTKTAEQILNDKNFVLISDIQIHLFPKQGDTTIQQSLLGLPLLHANQAIGVLFLVYPSLKNFDQNKIRFFSLVTDQIVTSVILSRLYFQMLKEESNRFLLSRFFSKNVTEEILAKKGMIRLGGDRKRATIVFADLRGFTSISEKIDQEIVVNILNEFFSQATPIIFKNEGTLDKLLGDGIMAVFGAPISNPQDPVRAIRTAIEIIQSLHSFNALHQHKDWPHLKIGIGISTGDVVAGYIGSKDHINYTVIGDTVNVAQRLENIAGEDEILVTKAVKDAIDDLGMEIQGMKAFTSLPPQHVKGKKEPVEIFRVEY